MIDWLGTRTPTQVAFIATLGSLPLLILGGVLTWWYYSLHPNPADRLGKSERAAIEQVVQEYILAHPEILPQAMENLQRRETLKQLTGVRQPLETPFPGAVLGNPQGKITMVEFTDFGCTYCRQSVADVEQLVRAHPDLRVVIREFPILSPHSEAAARMGLAAAEQGRYAAFHHAMFAAGRPDPDTIAAAATQAGLDLGRAKAFAASAAVTAEIERNMALARQLGFNGTPSWVIGQEVITGAVGLDRLTQAVRAARN